MEAKRHTEEALDLLTDAVENLPIGFSLFDEDARLVLFNEQYRGLFREHPEALKTGLTYEETVRLAMEQESLAEMPEDRDADGEIDIVITDTGGGIEDDVVGRLFEPFVTTKDVGKGTGLGLSISYGIITEMGGMIQAQNTDDGAQFTITLPVAQRELLSA